MDFEDTIPVITVCERKAANDSSMGFLCLGPELVSMGITLPNVAPYAVRRQLMDRYEFVMQSRPTRSDESSYTACY